MAVIIGKFKPSKNNSRYSQPEFDFSVITKLNCDGKWWHSEGAPGFKGVTSDGEDYHVFTEMWDFVPA